MNTTIKKLLTALFLLGILGLSACNFSVTSGNATADNLETVSKSEQKIRNRIQSEVFGGLKVESAFLMLETGELVSEENTIKAGDKIKFVLKLSGWKAENGMVQIGAGEQLVNSNQVVMMREDDLFANSKGISEKDAEVITLIMEVLNLETIYDFYQTDFKVWNKATDQHVYGSYHFKIKK